MSMRELYCACTCISVVGETELKISGQRMKNDIHPHQLENNAVNHTTQLQG